MTKLNELLATEKSINLTVQKLIQESKKTFTKESLFTGLVRKLEMFREVDKNSEHTEIQEVTANVRENLKYLARPITKWLNLSLQKELTNATARADLIVDGNVIATDVPATFLLTLETKLNVLRNLYIEIPTLPPGIKWIEDKNSVEGVYVSNNDTIQMKTKKQPEYIVVYEATPEHPAQIREVDRVIDIGRYVSTQYSGKMSSADKANLLSNIDKLIVATKQARMKANNVEVVTGHVGKNVLDYINQR